MFKRKGELWIEVYQVGEGGRGWGKGDGIGGEVVTWPEQRDEERLRSTVIITSYIILY